VTTRVSDARLGAGGVRPNTGSILYPGTPSGGRPGNILFPGSPPAQPIPSIVQPPPQRHPPVYGDGRGGKGRHGRGRQYAGDYPVYGFYPYAFAPNVIAVPGSTMTRSGAGYVITVGDGESEGDAAEIPSAEESSSEETVATETGDPDYWLIALRGGLIYAVSDYAIEARALRFVTLQGDEYVVPLAELDRNFTVKLNQDRNVRIELD
jgi:hypothetical protein